MYVVACACTAGSAFTYSDATGIASSVISVVTVITASATAGGISASAVRTDARNSADYSEGRYIRAAASAASKAVI